MVFVLVFKYELRKSLGFQGPLCIMNLSGAMMTTCLSGTLQSMLSLKLRLSLPHVKGESVTLARTVTKGSTDIHVVSSLGNFPPLIYVVE